MFPDDWRILIDYLAWITQHPGKKLQWAVLAQSNQRMGKSMFGGLMINVLGGDNIKLVSPDVIGGRFTEWGTGSLLAIIEEIKLSGHNRFETMDRIKQYITNELITVHPKGRSEYVAPNTQNYLLFTNHKDAMPLSRDDQRYCVLIAHPQQRQNQQYYGRLFAACNDCYTMKEWLMTWDISQDFSQFEVPLTAGRQEMEDINLGDDEILVMNFFENYPEKQQEVKADDILSQILREGFEISSKKLGRILSRLGYSCKIKKDEFRKTYRIWVKG